MSIRPLMLTVFAVVLVAPMLAPAPAAACPYDLLAMCCTEVSSTTGNCIRWQNCCEVLTTETSSDASEDGSIDLCPGNLMAADDCIESCDRKYSNTARRSTCYSSCSESMPTFGAGSPLFADDFTTPTVNPLLAQIGGFNAVVPMEHQSLGGDQWTHGLAVANGNLDVPFRLRFECPAGLNVEELRVQTSTGSVDFVNGGGPQTYDQNIVLQPFQPQDFEAACSEALGGIWSSNGGGHPNIEEVEITWMDTDLQVIGRCTGWANTLSRTFPAHTRAQCIDLEPVGDTAG